MLFGNTTCKGLFGYRSFTLGYIVFCCCCCCFSPTLPQVHIAYLLKSTRKKDTERYGHGCLNSSSQPPKGERRRKANKRKRFTKGSGLCQNTSHKRSDSKSKICSKKKKPLISSQDRKEQKLIKKWYPRPSPLGPSLSPVSLGCSGRGRSIIKNQSD